MLIHRISDTKEVFGTIHEECNCGFFFPSKDIAYKEVYGCRWDAITSPDITLHREFPHNKMCYPYWMNFRKAERGDDADFYNIELRFYSVFSINYSHGYGISHAFVPDDIYDEVIEMTEEIEFCPTVMFSAVDAKWFAENIVRKCYMNRRKKRRQKEATPELDDFFDEFKQGG